MGPTAHMRQVSTRTPTISSPAHANVCLFSPPLPRANASLRDRTSRAMLFCTCVPLAANILFRLELSVKWRLAVNHAVRPFVRDLYEWNGATMELARTPRWCDSGQFPAGQSDVPISTTALTHVAAAGCRPTSMEPWRAARALSCERRASSIAAFVQARAIVLARVYCRAGRLESGRLYGCSV